MPVHKQDGGRVGGFEKGALLLNRNINKQQEQQQKIYTKKKKTTAKERTLHHIHTVHLPFFSILIPRVLLPLF